MGFMWHEMLYFVLVFVTVLLHLYIQRLNVMTVRLTAVFQRNVLPPS
jgi:hypothetical protein